MKKLRKAMLAFPFILSSQAHAGMDPFYGEIMWTGYTYCPLNWVEADGRLLDILKNTALYSLLGTQFGGDGKTTFAVPDLRGAAAVGQGQKQDQNFINGQYRPGTGCPQGQQCPTTGTSTLTLRPCIAVLGMWPQRP